MRIPIQMNDRRNENNWLIIYTRNLLLLTMVAYFRYWAHADGVTCVTFNSDASQLLTSSYDSTIKIFGLNSGQKLKEYRCHTSWVNKAIYASNDSRILSASSDGTVKVYDQANLDMEYSNYGMHILSLSGRR